MARTDSGARVGNGTFQAPAATRPKPKDPYLERVAIEGRRRRVAWMRSPTRAALKEWRRWERANGAARGAEFAFSTGNIRRAFGRWTARGGRWR